jgi:hypothetical protein
LALVVIAVFAAVVVRFHLIRQLRSHFGPKATISDRLMEHASDARARLEPYFKEAGISYPPARLVLVGLKNEKALQLFASGPSQDLAFVRSYEILAASGTLGPKLKAGDRQVPEGIYKIESLNPNSRFHLSLRLNYPSPHDLARASEDQRTDLGSDIMIHGDNVSVGCLAVGDEAAEELFVLAAQVGLGKIRVILSPVDFRRSELPKNFVPTAPWTTELYKDIRTELSALPSPRQRLQ